MTDETRKPRSDKGVRRVVRKHPPHNISFQLLDEPLERDVSKSIRQELERMKRKDPKATVKSVILLWLGEYLGFKDVKP